MNNSQGIDQKDFIITLIDDHQHVIDCIKFAPETSCKTIQSADYNKLSLGFDPNQTSGSGDNMNDSTGDNTRGADDQDPEETKDADQSGINNQTVKTTKERV